MTGGRFKRYEHERLGGLESRVTASVPGEMVLLFTEIDTEGTTLVDRTLGSWLLLGFQVEMSAGNLATSLEL